MIPPVLMDFLYSRVISFFDEAGMNYLKLDYTQTLEAIHDILEHGNISHSGNGFCYRIKNSIENFVS
ncbi:MAG: hypothetical protein KG029_14590 [Bacteroidetes bacterium]|nr:hypothetical protein [Bacteroidota bacterium]